MTKRILAICSGGGHLVQMEAFLVVKDRWQVTFTLACPSISQLADISLPIPDCNARRPLDVVRCFFRLWKIIRDVKPVMIMSTGAAPGAIGIIVAKILYRQRVRTVWIDSVANVESASLSGRLIRKFCDIWFSQWASVAEENKGQYCGKLFNIFDGRDATAL